MPAGACFLAFSWLRIEVRTRLPLIGGIAGRLRGRVVALVLPI